MQHTKTLRCLLITPYSKEFSSLRRSLADILEINGIETIMREQVKTTILGGGVQRAIESADFIIADLTGSNPNVMYEMGLAHALRKPVLPIVQRGDEHVPSDISGYLYFVYDPSKPEELHNFLRAWISRYLSEEARMHGDE